MDVAPLVAPLRADVRAGAAEFTERALGVCEALLAACADDTGVVRDLEGLGRALIEAQPSMAPLVRIAGVAIDAAAAAPPGQARAAARAALASLRDTLARAGREVAARAEVLIPAGGCVLTLSSSSTVRAALLGAARRRTFEVVCLEGRPNFEGRGLAERLAGAGVPVTLAVDAAAGALLRNCDLVLVGADSIGDLGVMNKIGTRAAAAAARAAAIPAYVLADTTKLLPRGWPQRGDDDRPDTEVWGDVPPGVRIWNRYFEAAPLAWFAGVVTEHGLVEPEELERLRSRVRLPAALAG